MTDIADIKGVGSSKNVINLIAKIEQELYGLEYQFEAHDFFHNVAFSIGLKKINITHGQGQKRTPQAQSKENCQSQTNSTTTQPIERTHIDASYQRNGRQGSETARNSVTTIISDFFRELHSEFNRQHIYRRKDGKLVIQIFEYFKYLDFNDTCLKIRDDLISNPYYQVDFIYHICSYKQEDNDLILIVDVNTSSRIFEEKILLYPTMNIDIDTYHNTYKLTNEGFYIKCDNL